MSEDIFDVVDSADRVVASYPRSYVHSRKLMHRAVHVLIFAANRTRILLQMRSKEKDTYPLRYTTSCSGHVDSGECYDQSVVREMREETGISVDASALEKIGKIPPCPETGMEFTFVYALDVDESVSLSFSPDEVERFDWFDIPEFENMMAKNPDAFTPSFAKVYSFYLSQAQKRA